MPRSALAVPCSDPLPGASDTGAAAGPALLLGQSSKIEMLSSSQAHAIRTRQMETVCCKKGRMRPRTGLIMAAGLALSGICLFLFFERAKLASENRMLITAAESLRDGELARSQLEQQAQNGESEQHRLEHAELLRLRAEVSQLRRQITDARLVTNINGRLESKVNPSSREDSASTLAHYVSNLRLSVPWQHTVVTGGWQLPSGKHALFFMQPRRVNPAGDEEYNSSIPGQITLETWVAEVPDDVLSHSGLASLKNYSATDARHTMLSAQEGEATIAILQQTAGVDLLRAPKISTADGRPARIGMAGEQTGQSGPALDVTPVILQDGSGVDLRLSANLWLPKQ